MMPALSYVPRMGTQVPLEIVHFGDAAGEGNLYDDDGETFDYEAGKCGLWRASVTQQIDGSYVGQLTGPADKPQAYSAVTWCFAQTRL